MMEINDYRKRIAANILIASISDPIDGCKILCDIMVDSMNICAKKMELLAKQGFSTREEYNEVVEAYHKVLNCCTALVKAAPRNDSCRSALAKMTGRMIVSAVEIKVDADKIKLLPDGSTSPNKDTMQVEVDRILDKVSTQGINSLTQQEKDTLANFKP